MEPIGAHPRWHPTALADRLLVGTFQLAYVLALVPMRLLTLTLGWARVDWVALDLLSIPGALLALLGRLFGKRGARWGRRANALEHTHLVCRLCPASRQALRDPEGGKVCAWNRRWNQGDFEIEPNFGALNWLTQYVGKTHLERYASLSADAGPHASLAGRQEPAESPGVALWVTSAALNVLLLLGLAGCAPLAGPALHYWGAPDALTADDWVAVGSVPYAAEAYPPQGLTLWNGHLLLTNHWNDTRSELYQLDAETGAVTATGALPPEAVHVSGLGWDGTHLWVLDHATDYLYRMDPAALLRGEPAERGRWDTGLSGASALTVVTVDDTVYLALSDFLATSRTYLLLRDRVDDLATTDVPSLATASYRNRGFSQGLTWDGTYLYEAVNALGTDRIEVLDVTDALRSGGTDPVRRLGSLAAPGPMVEDLATDGTHLWTTDERTFQLYRLDDLPARRALLAR